jgi:hypothetical protein
LDEPKKEMLLSVHSRGTVLWSSRNNVKEFSRIGVNSAKTLEHASRDTARVAGQAL